MEFMLKSYALFSLGKKRTSAELLPPPATILYISEKGM
jgi:hypothetical protein